MDSVDGARWLARQTPDILCYLPPSNWRQNGVRFASVTSEEIIQTRTTTWNLPGPSGIRDSIMQTSTFNFDIFLFLDFTAFLLSICFFFDASISLYFFLRFSSICFFFDISISLYFLAQVSRSSSFFALSIKLYRCFFLARSNCK